MLKALALVTVIIFAFECGYVVGSNAAQPKELQNLKESKNA